MQLALKIEVGSLQGARKGVPRLLELLKKHQIPASFFFSLGKDQSGKRLFNAQFRRTPLAHYHFKSLLYGTLLPAPHMGEQCADILRQVRDAGFELGIASYQPFLWQQKIKTASAAWTKQQMQLAVQEFTRILGEAPQAHSAAGGQMNRHAYRLTQQLGFNYAADSRGMHAFIPTWDAEIFNCPQLPTTLPTLDQFIGHDGVTVENAASNYLKMTANHPQQGHIFTARAELEGGQWLAVFEQLLLGWQSQAYQLCTLNDYNLALKGQLQRQEVNH